jgi:hypothetical protein
MAEKKNDANLENQSVDTVYAENVTCSKVGIKSLNAGKVDMSKSGVGYLRAQTVNQESCGNAVIYAKTLKTDSVKSLITIADKIEGNVTTVLDKKGAAVFGLVVASVLLLFRLIRRLAR